MNDVGNVHRGTTPPRARHRGPRRGVRLRRRRRSRRRRSTATRSPTARRRPSTRSTSACSSTPTSATPRTTTSARTRRRRMAYVYNADDNDENDRRTESRRPRSASRSLAGRSGCRTGATTTATGPSTSPASASAHGVALLHRSGATVATTRPDHGYGDLQLPPRPLGRRLAGARASATATRQTQGAVTPVLPSPATRSQRQPWSEVNNGTATPPNAPGRPADRRSRRARSASRPARPRPSRSPSRSPAARPTSTPSRACAALAGGIRSACSPPASSSRSASTRRRPPPRAQDVRLVAPVPEPDVRPRDRDATTMPAGTRLRATLARRARPRGRRARRRPDGGGDGRAGRRRVAAGAGRVPRPRRRAGRRAVRSSSSSRGDARGSFSLHPHRPPAPGEGRRLRRSRDVAQPGSAPRSGRGGRGFESRHPDVAAPATPAGAAVVLPLRYPSGALRQIGVPLPDGHGRASRFEHRSRCSAHAPCPAPDAPARHVRRRPDGPDARHVRARPGRGQTARPRPGVRLQHRRALLRQRPHQWRRLPRPTRRA